MATQISNDAPNMGVGGVSAVPPAFGDEKPDRSGLFLLSVVMAMRGLEANKLRSFLTMLGVIIGVGATIVAIAIGQGSKAAVEESIARLGTNVLTVLPGSQRRGQVSFGGGSSQTLKIQDAEAIKKECPSVLNISPTFQRSSQIKYKANNNNTPITGTGEFYPEISAHPVTLGKYFTGADIRGIRRVAVLGSNVRKELFGTDSPMNKIIRIAGNNFTVIGVLKEKGGLGFRSPDDAVYVPVSTAQRRVFGVVDIVSSITVQARSFALLDRAQTEVEALIRKRHKLTGDAASDFIIFNQASLAETQKGQQDTFSSLITYLAIVSLVVGGIGIMNIMLVSVTERTREIGVRKAIGARRGDILTQFLMEALFLSLVGGLLGVLVGYGGSSLIGAQNGWKMVIEMQTVALAFSFSAVIGVFFGFYPAFKASQLNPIEALRYE